MKSERSGRFDPNNRHGPWPSRDESQLVEQFRRIAELQRHLLPREIPQPAGWRIATYYSVGPWPSGDYYDFRTIPAGQAVIAAERPNAPDRDLAQKMLLKPTGVSVWLNGQDVRYRTRKRAWRAHESTPTFWSSIRQDQQSDSLAGARR